MLSAEGVTFPVARTVAPLAKPALASMMTGLYPPQHGVRDEGDRLVDAAVTLAESAREAGFDTVAIVPGESRAREAGLDQGFALWTRPESLDGAQWLRERDGSRPFFLWVHLPGPVGPADATLGTLLDVLQERGEIRDTLILVVGTRGRSNGEHGESGSGTFVYEPTLRVPLFIRHPHYAGKKVDRGVASVVDVHPTLVRALGLTSAPGESAAGEDLLRPRDDGRGVYFESYRGYLRFGWGPLAGWVDARAKYVHLRTRRRSC